MSNRTVIPQPVAIALFLTGLIAVGAAAQSPQAPQTPRKVIPVTAVPGRAPTAVASAAAVPPASASGAPKTGRKINFRGDLYNYKEQTKVWTLTGNVWFKSEDTVLTTDAALYNQNTKIASSPGPLKIEDPQNTLTGKTGTAYYTTRDAKIRGNVVIVAKPGPENAKAAEGSPRRQFDSPATITCESVDYNWGTRVAFLTGNLKIVQKDRTVTGDKATYEGKAEKVTIEGNVVYTDSKDRKFKLKKAIIVFKEGEESFTGEDVQGTMRDEVMEDEIPDQPAAPAGNPPPASGTPPAKPGTPPLGNPPGATNPSPANPTGPPPTGNPPTPEPGKTP